MDKVPIRSRTRLVTCATVRCCHRARTPGDTFRDIDTFSDMLALLTKSD
jgi:hypothetical protein